MAIRRSIHGALMIATVVAALLAVTMTPVRGQVADNKTFDFEMTDAVFAGDADARLTFVLTNQSPNQELGSANVEVPDVLDVQQVIPVTADTVDGTTQLIELRDLGLATGESVEVVLEVDVRRCTAPAAGEQPEVQVFAKQSNTFKGTGNDFFPKPDVEVVEIVGTCTLAFAAQPRDAQRETAITSVDYDPQGAPIAVEVRDAGDTGPATHSTATIALQAINRNLADDEIVLDGATSATANAGLATFDPGPTLTPSAFDYMLVARPDFDAQASVTSDAFDILDSVVKCPANLECEATAERGSQRINATFGAGPNDDTLVVALGSPGITEFTCENSTPGASQGLVFMPGGIGDRAGLISYAFSGTRPLNTYAICWAAPYPFDAEGPLQVLTNVEKPDGTVAPELYVGELQKCARRGEPSIHCEVRRTFDNATSTVEVEIRTTNEDPWMRH
jgi:hypothetical protein